jgi:hypothetical protein
MNSVLPIKNLNSQESYLSAIHQVRMLEKNVCLAEKDQSIDFSQQIQAISALQQAVLARTQSGIPADLQGVHLILEEALQQLSKRVDAVSEIRLASSSQDVKKTRFGSSNLSWREAVRWSSLAAGLALCYSQFRFENSGNAPKGSPKSTTHADQEPVCPEIRLALPWPGDPVTSHVEEKRPELRSSIPLKDRECVVRKDVKEMIVPVRGSKEPLTVGSLLQLDAKAVPIDGETISKCRVAREPEVVKDIAANLRDLIFLGGLLLARHGINSASPVLTLAGMHRGYHILRLSGALEGVKNHTPEFASEWVESAVDGYSKMEARLPISTSRMLESMTTIDRWAAVGLMDLVRSAPGIQGLASAHPALSYLVSGPGWTLLSFTPFLIGIDKGSETPPLLGDRKVTAPTDEKQMSGYVQDVAYLARIYLTGRALNQAAPLLFLAVSNRMYNMIRLCNVTELEKEMPLLAAGIEKTAGIYGWIEEKMPGSPSEILKGMTDMDSWALVGLADLIRNVPGVQWLAGNVPILSSLIANDRGWRFMRYTPLFLPLAGMGINFQPLLLR